MGRYTLAGMIMTALHFLPGQIRAEDVISPDMEEAIIVKEECMIVQDEDTDPGDMEPEPPEGGMTEEFLPFDSLIEEDEDEQGLSPVLSMMSYEEGGEILLDDPMTVENEITKGGPDEVILRRIPK